MEIHSDWGNWLVREIESAEPDGVDIWFLGCNGFAIKGSAGTTLLIDPYLGFGDPPRTVRMAPVPFDPDAFSDVDAVFATHEHSDHVHGETQGPILRETGATMYGPDDSMARTQQEAWTEQFDISADQLQTVVEGQELSIGEFTVTVEPAADPDATHPVSYVVDHETGTFFHGGDTKPGDVLADVGDRHDIDLGVLALGSVGLIPDKETREPARTRWYSDENQVIEAANSLQLSRLLPSHWDIWKGLTADPTALHHHARSYPYPDQLEIVEIGDRVSL